MSEIRPVLKTLCLLAALVAPCKAYSEPVPDAARAADQPRTRFVRIATDEHNREISLQVSIVTYVSEKKDNGVEVDLLSAVHIGDATYYGELRKRFRDYDAVLFELIVSEEAAVPSGDRDGGGVISNTQVAMKNVLGLSFQLDEIDYTSDNFVHADLTADQLSQSMAERNESLYVYFWRIFYDAIAQMREDPYGIQDLKLMSRLFASGHSNVPKVMLAHEIVKMDRPRAILDAGSGSAIIDARNQRAIDVLKEQLASDAQRIGIFYGAAHMPDLEERLVTQLGMVRHSIEWIDAWDLVGESSRTDE